MGNSELAFPDLDEERGIEKRTGQSCSVGVPSAEKMTLSWSMSDSAAMNGTRSINSAKMQPAAQTSTPVLYDRAPRSSSGQRYQLRVRAREGKIRV